MFDDDGHVRGHLKSWMSNYIINVTKVNKKLSWDLKFIDILPAKYTKLNAQRIKMILQYKLP